jgi:hypothetical protein
MLPGHSKCRRIFCDASYFLSSHGFTYICVTVTILIEIMQNYAYSQEAICSMWRSPAGKGRRKEMT